MKNIYIIPTNKPSKLHEFGGVWFRHKEPTECCRNYNIYITSDLKIKEGEKGWLLENNDITKNVCEFDCSNGLGGIYPTDKKIILTTDPTLIADGIQSIDDTFLKWFVKNPTCTSFEITTYNVKGDISGMLYYKIIIPQKEPKQETLVRDYSNRSCQTCNLFNTNNSGERACELELESECASYGNDETLKDFWISCLDDESDSVLYRQETLEEAAEKRIPTSPKVWDLTETRRSDFIAGAKSDAARDYWFKIFKEQFIVSSSGK